MKIGPVKNDLSFLVILKFIYGLEICFSDLDKAVLCEIMCLSEKYKITDLLNDLKRYLAKFDSFEMDTIVPVLNTAKSFHLHKLYEKAKLFVNDNADTFVSHVTLVDLREDIFEDIIKSDNFFTDELDILKGVLTWHDDNLINSNENVLITDNDSGVGSSTSDNNLDQEISTYEKINSKLLLKEFSDNIMIRLLSHIRFHLISPVRLHQFKDLELYKKYRKFLDDFKYGSSITMPRKKSSLLQQEVYLFEERDINKKFTINSCTVVGLKYNHMNESVEEVLSGDLKWKLCFDTREIDAFDRLMVFLKFSSTELKDWEITVNGRIKLISSDENTSACFPFDGSCTSISTTAENPCVQFGHFLLKENWRKIYGNSLGFWKYATEFEIYLEFIYIKVKQH